MPSQPRRSYQRDTWRAIIFQNKSVTAKQFIYFIQLNGLICCMWFECQCTSSMFLLHVSKNKLIALDRSRKKIRGTIHPVIDYPAHTHTRIQTTSQQKGTIRMERNEDRAVAMTAQSADMNRFIFLFLVLELGCEILSILHAGIGEKQSINWRG